MQPDVSQCSCFSHLLSFALIYHPHPSSLVVFKFLQRIVPAWKWPVASMSVSSLTCGVDQNVLSSITLFLLQSPVTGSMALFVISLALLNTSFFTFSPFLPQLASIPPPFFCSSISLLTLFCYEQGRIAQLLCIISFANNPTQTTASFLLSLQAK
jgi:hypothetical protein